MDAAHHQFLRGMFAGFNIDTERPGFYDDRRFIRAEQVDPGFLQKYGEFVDSRPLGEDYVARARKEIPVIAKLLWGSW